MGRILLNFDDKYRIEQADPRNIRIQEFREFQEIVNGKPTGNTYKAWDEKADCYYSTIKGALRSIFNKKLSSESTTNIKELLNILDRIEKRIESIVEKNFKGEEDERAK